MITNSDDARLRRGDREAEDALEIGEAVVAAEAGVVAEEQQHDAKVSACVMIEKYTPLMRERNAK